MRRMDVSQVSRKIAGKAENSGQISAAVGATTALRLILTLGADYKGFRDHRQNGSYYQAL